MASAFSVRRGSDTYDNMQQNKSVMSVTRHPEKKSVVHQQENSKYDELQALPSDRVQSSPQDEEACHCIHCSTFADYVYTHFNTKTLLGVRT